MFPAEIFFIQGWLSHLYNLSNADWCEEMFQLLVFVDSAPQLWHFWNNDNRHSSKTMYFLFRCNGRCDLLPLQKEIATFEEFMHNKLIRNIIPIQIITDVVGFRVVVSSAVSDSSVKVSQSPSATNGLLNKDNDGAGRREQCTAQSLVWSLSVYLPVHNYYSNNAQNYYYYWYTNFPCCWTELDLSIATFRWSLSICITYTPCLYIKWNVQSSLHYNVSWSSTNHRFRNVDFCHARIIAGVDTHCSFHHLYVAQRSP